MREQGENGILSFLKGSKKTAGKQTYAESVTGPDDTDQWLKKLGNQTAPVGSTTPAKPEQKPYNSAEYQFSRADSAQTAHKIDQHNKSANQATLKGQMGSGSTPRTGK